MPPTVNKLIPYIAAIVAVLFWAGNFTVARFAGFERDLPPLFLAFSRWAVALLIIAPWAIPQIIRDRAEIAKTPIVILICAITGVGMFAAFTYIAAETTFSINLSLIAMAAPLFTAIVTTALNRALPSKRTMIALLVCVFGVSIIIFGTSEDASINFRIGDLWMLAAALSWGIYTALITRVSSKVSSLALFGITVILGLLLLLPFSILEFWLQGSLNLSVSAVPVILYLGVFVSVFGYLLWNYAARKLGSIKTGAIYFLIPFFTAVISSVFLKENIYMMQVFGFIVVLVGIMMIREQRFVSGLKHGVKKGAEVVTKLLREMRAQ